MAEFARTTYNYNNRIILNDVTTDPDKYVLVDPEMIRDTIAENVEEMKPTEPGIIDYGIKFGRGTALVPITLYATDQPNMSQLIQNVKEAFNPDLLEADPTYGEATDFNGYLPFDWTENVGGTSRDFRIWLKSMETPKADTDSTAGLIREVLLRLKARDPRKYLQATQTRTGAGAAVNSGTYTTPITITVTATGTTLTTLTITNSTTNKSIYVTTALTTGQVLVIDTFFHTAKLNGTDTRSMLGSNTEWWTLNPGSNTLAITNDTNATIGFEWRSAWPL